MLSPINNLTSSLRSIDAASASYLLLSPATVSLTTRNFQFIILLFIDDGSLLCRQMLESYSAAIAPGTQNNRKKQAEEYTRFSLIHQVDYLNPSLTQACKYAQFLANKLAAPASIINYLSGAKTWVTEHQGSIQAFLNPQLAQLVKGFVKNSSHIPSRAPPLLPHHIRAICRLADGSPSMPLALKPAVLIGYNCFLRASNLTSVSFQEWGGPHTLLAGDIALRRDGLEVYIRSTKTKSASQAFAFLIPPGEDISTCPVRAWRFYFNMVRPWALGPAFIHMHGLPLTSPQVVKIMRLALKDHSDIEAGRVSMHSLRRGATQAAVEQGIPLQEIQARGTWTTVSGMRPYLATQPRSVKTVPLSNLA